MKYEYIVHRVKELAVFKIDLENGAKFSSTVNCRLGRYIPKNEYALLRMEVVMFCRDNKLKFTLDGPVKSWKIES